MPVFFDTHAHLDCADFSGDLPQIIERARDAGVTTLVSVATDLESSARAIEIAEQYPNIYAAVGWHPNDALKAPNDLRPALRAMAQHPKVVAIGETGLDYYRLSKKTTESVLAEVARIKQRQAEIFQQQLEVAAEFGLNCIVHQRSSFEDTLAQLRPFAGRVQGVFHCFSESPETLQRVLNIGCIVSFTGILTFKNAQTVRDALAAVPDGQFMLETDCPYLAPEPFRGNRCEPAYLKETADIAAQVRKCSLEELSLNTCETARRFFKKISI